MKSIFLLLIYFLAITEIRSQSKLNIVLTQEHRLIKDSKVFIIPPENFRLLLDLMGYANNETGAHFSVIQSYKSFTSIKSHLSEKYLRGKEYKIIEMKSFRMNKLSAYWYELENQFMDRTTIKYILIIGNKHEHAMIEAYCPKEHQLANIALRKSLFTVYYDIDSVSIKKVKLLQN